MQIRDNQLLLQWNNFTPKTDRRESKNQLPTLKDPIWFVWVHHLHCWPDLNPSSVWNKTHWNCLPKSTACPRRLQQQIGAHRKLNWGAPDKLWAGDYWVWNTLQVFFPSFDFYYTVNLLLWNNHQKNYFVRHPNIDIFLCLCLFLCFFWYQLVNSVEVPKVLQKNCSWGVKKSAHTLFLAKPH